MFARGFGRQQTRSAIGKGTVSSKPPPAKRIPVIGSQLKLDFGGKNPSSLDELKCTKCGMAYIRGSEDDVLHTRYCNQAILASAQRNTSLLQLPLGALTALTPFTRSEFSVAAPAGPSVTCMILAIPIPKVYPPPPPNPRAVAAGCPDAVASAILVAVGHTAQPIPPSQPSPGIVLAAVTMPSGASGAVVRDIAAGAPARGAVRRGATAAPSTGSGGDAVCSIVGAVVLIYTRVSAATVIPPAAARARSNLAGIVREHYVNLNAINRINLAAKGANIRNYMTPGSGGSGPAGSGGRRADEGVVYICDGVRSGLSALLRSGGWGGAGSEGLEWDEVGKRREAGRGRAVGGGDGGEAKGRGGGPPNRGDGEGGDDTDDAHDNDGNGCRSKGGNREDDTRLRHDGDDGREGMGRGHTRGDVPHRVPRSIPAAHPRTAPNGRAAAPADGAQRSQRSAGEDDGDLFAAYHGWSTAVTCAYVDAILSACTCTCITPTPSSILMPSPRSTAKPRHRSVCRHSPCVRNGVCICPSTPPTRGAVADHTSAACRCTCFGCRSVDISRVYVPHDEVSSNAHNDPHEDTRACEEDVHDDAKGASVGATGGPPRGLFGHRPGGADGAFSHGPPVGPNGATVVTTDGRDGAVSTVGEAQAMHHGRLAGAHRLSVHALRIHTRAAARLAAATVDTSVVVTDSWIGAAAVAAVVTIGRKQTDTPTRRVTRGSVPLDSRKERDEAVAAPSRDAGGVVGAMPLCDGDGNRATSCRSSGESDDGDGSDDVCSETVGPEAHATAVAPVVGDVVLGGAGGGVGSGVGPAVLAPQSANPRAARAARDVGAVGSVCAAPPPPLPDAPRSPPAAAASAPPRGPVVPAEADSLRLCRGATGGAVVCGRAPAPLPPTCAHAVTDGRAAGGALSHKSAPTSASAHVVCRLLDAVKDVVVMIGNSAGLGAAGDALSETTQSATASIRSGQGVQGVGAGHGALAAAGGGLAADGCLKTTAAVAAVAAGPARAPPAPRRAPRAAPVVVLGWDAATAGRLYEIAVAASGAVVGSAAAAGGSMEPESASHAALAPHPGKPDRKAALMTIVGAVADVGHAHRDGAGRGGRAVCAVCGDVAVDEEGCARCGDRCVSTAHSQVTAAGR